MPDKTLYRSTSNRMISGICGGLAEYFDVDSSVIRIALVAFTVITLPAFGPFVFLAYLVCVFIIPRNPYPTPANAAGTPAAAGESGQAGQAGEAIQADKADKADQANQQFQGNPSTSRNNSTVWGILLVLLAVIVLTYSYTPDYGRFSYILPVVPVLAIAAAAFILFVYRGEIMEFFRHRRLYRLNEGRKIFGVCNGLADAFDLDPTLVRIGFFIAFLFSVGTVTLLYLFMACVRPVGRPESPVENA